MARETLAGTDYALRPIYDELLDQLGQPPLGCPEECQFHWGTQPLTMLAPGSSKGRYIYVEQDAEVDLREIEGDDIVVIRLPSTPEIVQPESNTVEPDGDSDSDSDSDSDTVKPDGDTVESDSDSDTNAIEEE